MPKQRLDTDRAFKLILVCVFATFFTGAVLVQIGPLLVLELRRVSGELVDAKTAHLHEVEKLKADLDAALDHISPSAPAPAAE